MPLPDVKVATDLMKQLEDAINVANAKQKIHDEADKALSFARNELNDALAKVDNLNNKLFQHLGAGNKVRQSS